METSAPASAGTVVVAAAFGPFLAAVLLMAPMLVGALDPRLRIHAAPGRLRHLGRTDRHGGGYVSGSLPDAPGDWRAGKRACPLLMAAGNLISTAIDGFACLLIARFITATAAGAAFVVTLALARDPESAFGGFTLTQYVLGALGLWALPLLLPITGLAGFYMWLAALALCALTLGTPPDFARVMYTGPAGCAAAFVLALKNTVARIRRGRAGGANEGA